MVTDQLEHSNKPEIKLKVKAPIIMIDERLMGMKVYRRDNPYCFELHLGIWKFF
jgi:hypothetical protein